MRRSWQEITSTHRYVRHREGTTARFLFRTLTEAQYDVHDGDWRFDFDRCVYVTEGGRYWIEPPL